MINYFFCKDQNEAKWQQETKLDSYFNMTWHAQNNSLFSMFSKYLKNDLNNVLKEKQICIKTIWRFTLNLDIVWIHAIGQVGYGPSWAIIFCKQQNRAKRQQETKLDNYFSMTWHAQNDGLFSVFSKYLKKRFKNCIERLADLH